MLAKRFNTSLQIPEALTGTSMQQDCYPLVLCWQFVSKWAFRTLETIGKDLLTPEARLSDPMYEHDGCVLGFVARIDGLMTRLTVEEGLEVLHNLEHRGTTGSDPETGDGAGILTQIPDGFFRKKCSELGIELPEAGRYGVGMLFESEEAGGLGCEDRLAEICAEEGQDL